MADLDLAKPTSFACADDKHLVTDAIALEARRVSKNLLGHRFKNPRWPDSDFSAWPVWEGHEDVILGELHAAVLDSTSWNWHLPTIEAAAPTQHDRLQEGAQVQKKYFDAFFKLQLLIKVVRTLQKQGQANQQLQQLWEAAKVCPDLLQRSASSYCGRPAVGAWFSAMWRLQDCTKTEQAAVFKQQRQQDKADRAAAAAA